LTVQKYIWLLIGVWLFTSSVAQARALALTTGDPAPPMRGQLSNGDLLLVDYEPSQLTVVNFWATWCEPCRNEMPSLNQVQQLRSKDGLQVIGVHVGRIDDEELATFGDSLSIDYPLISTTDRWLSGWGGLSILPRTYLIDDQGLILRVYVGATPKQIEAMVFDIEAALDGRTMGPVVVPDAPDVATPEDRDKAKVGG
jgi:thiol-disulfide isomerase/thioredoxin